MSNIPCEAAIDRMHAALDGDLAPEAAAELDAHTADCASCRELRSDLAQLAVRARQLPRELPIARDLWPSIRARLRPRARGASWRRWGGVALLAAAALLALRSLAPVDSAPTSDEGALAAQTDDLQQGIEALQREIEARESELDPETLAIVRRNLAIIDAAIEETEAALQREGNGAAREALASLKQHKLALLRKLTDLPQHG